MLARVVDPDSCRFLSALVRSPHHLHGVFDVTPLLRILGIALALASQGILGGLGDRPEAVLLEHLPCDDVNLHLGNHVALPMFAHSRKPQASIAVDILRPVPNRPAEVSFPGADRIRRVTIGAAAKRPSLQARMPPIPPLPAAFFRLAAALDGANSHEKDNSNRSVGFVA